MWLFEDRFILRGTSVGIDKLGHHHFIVVEVFVWQVPEFDVYNVTCAYFVALDIFKSLPHCLYPSGLGSVDLVSQVVPHLHSSRFPFCRLQPFRHKLLGDSLNSLG